MFGYHDQGISSNILKPLTTTKSGKFKLVSNSGQKEGYTGKFCVKCESDHASAVNGPIILTQTGSCYDELDLKSDAASYNPIPFTKADNVAELKNFSPDGYTDFFTNKDKTNCPVTGCVLKALSETKTCGAELPKN